MNKDLAFQTINNDKSNNPLQMGGEPATMTAVLASTTLNASMKIPKDR